MGAQRSSESSGRACTSGTDARSGGRTALTALVSSLLGGSLLVTGCQPSPPVDPPTKVLAADAALRAGTSAAEISIEPGRNARRVRPDAPVVVRVTGGRLTEVRVSDRSGRSVLGGASDDGTLWESSAGLTPDTAYTVQARARSSTGTEVAATSTFRTLEPATTLTTAISPLDGQTVGVGMPVVVRFSEPIRDRAGVERRLSVRPSVPVEGSWHWVDDRQVHWRPRQYWPAYTDVTLDVRTGGVEAAPGTWGEADRTIRFRVGASMVSTVDARSLRMRVVRDGRVVRTVPVTTGKKGFITRSGIKVVSEKYRMKIMDARTVRIRESSPEYYRLKVPYAMRVTTSGEFVHGAPWSEGQQGRARVSHGCVGMSEKNAAWFFGQSSIGDVIDVVGTNRPLEPGNGWTDWNVPWEQWRAGSALA